VVGGNLKSKLTISLTPTIRRPK